MGGQSVSEYYNKYTEASKKEKMCTGAHMEEEFVKELKKFCKTWARVKSSLLLCK